MALSKNINFWKIESFFLIKLSFKMKTTHTFKHLLLALFTVSSFLTYAQKGNQIVIGQIDSIQSKILNENRKVWVYVPGGGQLDIYVKQRYPVVYLLDGDAHFSSVVGMIQQLSTVNGNMICPEMIVVGIPNTDRMRDLSPTHVVSDGYMSGDFLKTTGGGEAFTSFIEKELMPYIESKYPTEPYKMLIGHSLGGLMVMNTIVHHPDLFNSYVAIDPSMWWDNKKLLNDSKKIMAERKFQGKSLFLGIANTMNEGMTVEKVQKDTSNDTRHIRSILELKEDLARNKQNGLKVESKYYGDDSHGSVPLITEYDALHFIFDFYPLKLTRKEQMDTGTILPNKYATHFANVSKQLGYRVKPSEGMINGMGYQALASKQLQKAESFFKLNIANYPESGNVYDSYGDYFIDKKDTVNAIIQFKKALSVKENADTRQKLEELQGNKKMLQLTATDLQKYAGEFEITSIGLTLKTYVTNGTLRVLASDRPEAELVPSKLHEFKVKDVSGYNFIFEMVGDKPSAINLSVPEGNFKATLKK